MLVVVVGVADSDEKISPVAVAALGALRKNVRVELLGVVRPDHKAIVALARAAKVNVSTSLHASVLLGPR